MALREGTGPLSRYAGTRANNAAKELNITNINMKGGAQSREISFNTKYLFP